MIYFLCAIARAGVNPEMSFVVAGDAPVTEKTEIDVFGSMLVANETDNIYTTQVGPGVRIREWLWASVRAGMVMHFPGVEEAMPVASAWSRLNLRHDRLSVMVREDFIPDLKDGSVHLYGAFESELRLGMSGIGLHAEHFDDQVTAGPRVGIEPSELIEMSLEYHWDFSDEHTVRMVTSLHFH